MELLPLKFIQEILYALLSKLEGNKTHNYLKETTYLIIKHLRDVPTFRSERFDKN